MRIGKGSLAKAIHIIWKEAKNAKFKIALSIFLLLAVSVLSLLIPVITKYIIDDGIIKQRLDVVQTFAIILLVTIFVKCILEVINACVVSNVNVQVKMGLFKRAIKKLEYIHFDYFNHNNVTKIFNDMNNDINTLSLLCDATVFRALATILTLFGGIICILILNPFLAVVTLFSIPIKYLLMHFLAKINKKLTQILIQINSKFAIWFSDFISGIRDIRIYGMSKQSETEAENIKREAFAQEVKLAVLSGGKDSVDVIVSQILTTLIYYLGSILIFNKEMSLGTLIAFLSYVVYVTTPVGTLMNLKFVFASVVPALNRIQKFFDEKEECLEIDKKKTEIKIDSIEFKQVSFDYGCGKVIDGLSFKINRGEKIMITGENGSGKSTIISLLLGLYKPTGGKILINGRNIDEFPITEIRNKISISDSVSHIFNRDICENISLGAGKTKDKMEDIMKELGLDFSMRNEGIINVSSGERQKVLLARILYLNRDIVVLDEAIANIDVGFKEKIEKLFNEWFENKTLIYISHSGELFEKMDKIVKL